MTCDRTQHATTLTRPYVPFAGALVGRPPDGRWHARVVRDQQIGVAASVASLWRCVRRSGTMRDMRERVLVGVAVICLVIGAFIALAGFDYHDVRCDGPAFAAWTNVKVPEDDGRRLRDVLSLCAPTARARLAVAGLAGGVGIGVGVAVVALRRWPGDSA